MNLDNYFNDSPIRCLSEVNPNYPDKLHDMHNNYPLADEKIKVTEKVLSEYQQLQIMECHNFYLYRSKNLIPNVGSKIKYKLHYQILNFLLNLKLQLKKIHRTLEFKQEPF